ncbi:FKBP-type peptidyl-prolyl cis-trans isomerase [Agromyces bauzanensis]|uniref:Peptidyl-prolyl cis-trans isomerase n=1 Tax=Agromyces bauzanensis TaxID=1308924 RepID=A0A917UQH6_9MICO|nr:FKBP-type peptidyl-prolyl cis-trans isomerase [Agromyces bauzanensis]GGJ77173.1 peptidylprolyl isomerase [Agromyces bauzanensis]
MRSSFVLIATAGLVAVTLSGCASAPAPEAQAGQSSDVVVVTGDFGETPRVEFPTPLVPGETQCAEVIAGEGERLREGQHALIRYAVYNGANGDQVEVTGYGDQDPVEVTLVEGLMPGLRKALTCANEGSRVVAVIPSDDGLGDAGNAALGIAGGDSLVFVVDVERAFLTRADGSVRLSRDGFPAVVLAPDGRPGITIPNNDPPVGDTSEVAVLKQGNGQTIEDGDAVVVHYTGVLWDDSKTVFDSSWENGRPATFVVGEGGNVIPGFTTALVGQKVGSQIGVIVPPSEGYGEEGNGQVPGGATLFFVVDILGVI